MSDFFCNNWTDIFVSFIGAFFGFGLALIIEYLKLSSDKKKEKQTFERDQAKKVEYFIILLEEVNTKFQRQLELIQEYIENQKKSLIKIQPLKRVSTNCFIRLKNIDNKGIFEALADKFKFDKDWIKEYNRLNSSLDFLEGVYSKELVRINKRTLEKGYSDLLHVKDLINKIPDILSREAINKVGILGNNRFEDPEYIFINESIRKYHQLVEDKSDLDQFDRDLLESLIDSSLSHPENAYLQEVAYKCKDARVRMTDIKKDVEQTISSYEEIIKSLKKPMDKIGEIIILLKN